MIVVTEHRGGDDFLDLARSPGSLGCGRGFRRRVGRSPDDPQVWTIVTSWRDVVGSIRRGFDRSTRKSPLRRSWSVLWIACLRSR